MAVALKTRVLDARHKFETPLATAAMQSKTIKLAAHGFQPAKTDRTLEWNRLVGVGRRAGTAPAPPTSL
jgi:hypothetical protein